MIDIDLPTALSVFGKLPQEKIAFVLNAAVDVSTDKLSGNDLPSTLAKSDLNELEVQLGVLAATHHTGFLRELGPEHINSIRHFVTVLLTKSVAQDKIVSALRGVGLDDEHIRAALALMKIWVPGRILEMNQGRGVDEISQKMRELFDLYLAGFLMREPVGRLTLVRMAMEPEKDRVLRFLLSEIPRIDPLVKQARPFWWSAEHEKHLVETLMKRVPVLVLKPLASMADRWAESPSPEAFKSVLKEAKLPPYLVDLFPYLGGKQVLADPPTGWDGLTREIVAEEASGFYLHMITFWAFFYFHSKGSPGYRKATDSVENLLGELRSLFVTGGQIDLTGFEPDIQDLLVHAMALGATFPLPAATRLRNELGLESAKNTSAIAKRFRQLMD